MRSITRLIESKSSFEIDYRKKSYGTPIRSAFTIRAKSVPQIISSDEDAPTGFIQEVIDEEVRDHKRRVTGTFKVLCRAPEFVTLRWEIGAVDHDNPPMPPALIRDPDLPIEVETYSTRIDGTATGVSYDMGYTASFLLNREGITRFSVNEGKTTVEQVYRVSISLTID